MNEVNEVAELPICVHRRRRCIQIGNILQMADPAQALEFASLFIYLHCANGTDIVYVVALTKGMRHGSS